MAMYTHSTLASRRGAQYHGLGVTREEYLDLEFDGYKYDMIHGRLFVTPSPGFEHGNIEGMFFARLVKFLREHNVGKISLEIDVLLPDGGDILRPDISFILNEHLSLIKTHIHGAPDLVAEILSPSTRERDLGEKAERYLKNGVSEYWILDPDAKSMEMRVNENRENWIVHRGEELESRLLKGLVVTTGDLY